MTETDKQFDPPQNAIRLMDTAEKVFDEAKYDLSIQYYTQAIAHVNAPANLAYALYMRGCAYQKTGYSTQAHKDWKKAQNLGFNMS